MARPDPVSTELLRLPVGTRVRVRGCPGLGFGVVKSHITEHVVGSQKNRVTIPLIGHRKMFVEFEDKEQPGGEFQSSELARAR